MTALKLWAPLMFLFLFFGLMWEATIWTEKEGRPHESNCYAYNGVCYDYSSNDNTD